ncbi:hypothetical protein [Campylobacter sp. RM16190]|uniref:DUF6115 domain-containing protein n=1 Tax=Campylobacter sp. RM16190 TaxID=1705727 RepID=UPI0014749352|nr:hypothetical protein [Campylobacter sp. RM16190]
MSSDFIIFIGLGLILVILFLLVVFKDMEAGKKFSRYEKVLEGIIQENHLLKKQLNNIEIAGSANIDVEAIELRLEQRLNEQINSKIIPIVNTLKGIETSIDSFQEEQQNRIYTLEERTKTIGKITSNSEETDEKRIIDMYKDGKNIETIAKDLRLGIGKVEFVLKFNKLI